MVMKHRSFTQTDLIDSSNFLHSASSYSSGFLRNFDSINHWLLLSSAFVKSRRWFMGVIRQRFHTCYFFQNCPKIHFTQQLVAFCITKLWNITWCIYLKHHCYNRCFFSFNKEIQNKQHFQKKYSTSTSSLTLRKKKTCWLRWYFWLNILFSIWYYFVSLLSIKRALLLLLKN